MRACWFALEKGIHSGVKETITWICESTECTIVADWCSDHM